MIYTARGFVRTEESKQKKIGVSDDVKNYLLRNPKIMSTYRYDGQWDISMGVLVKDAIDFREVLDDIRNNYCITRCRIKSDRNTFIIK